jgi:hypothetical protein
VILDKQSILGILLVSTLLLSMWPIYRTVGKRYWILALPYGLNALAICIRFNWEPSKFANDMPGSIVVLFLPLPFHVGAYLVKRFDIKV